MKGYYNMKTILIVILTSIALIAMFGSGRAAQLNTKPEGLEICDGKFALCAASTCVPTGKTITVQGKEYPEASCQCPVLEGKALADVDGGNMQGTCDTKDKAQVWRLFSYKAFLPQQMNDWSKSPAKQKTRVQECGSELNLGADTVNCFSMSCEITKDINGTEIASCSCPIGQSVENTDVDPATSFLIQSGQGNPEYCDKNPVAITPFRN